MKWLKAGLIGALGSLLMFILIQLGIGSDIAPFDVAPSAAFLEAIGFNVGPLPLIVHFGQGIFWSIVLVAVFGRGVDLVKGLGLAVILWLVMMVVYSPMIGWGFFGFGASETVASLGSPIKYVVATLVLHLVYGATIGWLNPVWITFERDETEPATA